MLSFEEKENKSRSLLKTLRHWPTISTRGGNARPGNCNCGSRVLFGHAYYELLLVQRRCKVGQ
ncbi:hypothetical protein ZHAS_00015010 [Anopheles sinensis]|uniref:Uncharacterized protein n=1 Tax=Anopheles sinensis TaxID=74873 RepID=A0A084W9T0_ANOSI|nr:hypothetical protein ZHAS_00015010 [Anopheles sinensis]